MMSSTKSKYLKVVWTIREKSDLVTVYIPIRKVTKVDIDKDILEDK